MMKSIVEEKMVSFKFEEMDGIWLSIQERYIL